ncbi:GNAT family N-acetyltransferase [Nesterenkonia muleiensis]|uniref:GNAT family N-acetyltransferase n=1 Tax=Nesterenkonia muleiensis TaxID=2282648 RepID=UPI000E70ABFE|nr:GNAT family N-acetyltransferase [Nesterenkonia muleiensis]
MVTVLPIHQAPDAALQLVTESIADQHGTPLVADTSPVDPATAAQKLLKPYAEQTEMASGWLALDEGGSAVALLGASLVITDEDHPGYSFLPERFAQIGLGHAAARDEAAIEHLDALLQRIRDDAAAHSISRLMVSVRPHDWIMGSFWRSHGLQPEKLMAGRRVPAEIPESDYAVTVRPAVPEDEEQLIALCMEEYEYHALHTTAPHRRNQAVEPTRRYVSGGFDDVVHPRCLVAEDPDTGQLVGCLFLRINEQPRDSAIGMFMPRRRGFIGLTSVTESWRGRGAGSALLSEALRVFADRDVPYAFLFYVESNVLSKEFWNRRGFSPVAVDMAGEALG